MVYSTGYALITGQPLSQSSTGSARSVATPTRLTSDQIQQIFEDQSSFPFREDVIRRFTPPSDQAIDLQRKILQELNRIFTKHGMKAKDFEQAVHKDFAAYLTKQRKEIGLVAVQCWENQLRAAFTAANAALSGNRRSTATLTTMSSVATSSRAQRIDKEFRARIEHHISDKEVIEILSNELRTILEKNKSVGSFASAVQCDFENFVMSQPTMDDGDMVYVAEELKNAMRAVKEKEEKEEKEGVTEATITPMLAVALPVSISSSSLISQTDPTVMQRIQAVFTKIWDFILNFFANLAQRFQK